jgi:hypothetical protein
VIVDAFVIGLGFALGLAAAMLLLLLSAVVFQLFLAAIL